MPFLWCHPHRSNTMLNLKTLKNVHLGASRRELNLQQKEINSFNRWEKKIGERGGLSGRMKWNLCILSICKILYGENNQKEFLNLLNLDPLSFKHFNLINLIIKHLNNFPIKYFRSILALMWTLTAYVIWLMLTWNFFFKELISFSLFFPFVLASKGSLVTLPAIGWRRSPIADHNEKK